MQLPHAFCHAGAGEGRGGAGGPARARSCSPPLALHSLHIRLFLLADPANTATQPLVRRWLEENGTWMRVHCCGCMLPCCSFALPRHTNRRQLQLRPPHRLQIFGEWACFITFGMVTLKPMARTCTGTTPYCRIGTSTCKPSMQVSCARVDPQSPEHVSALTRWAGSDVAYIPPLDVHSAVQQRQINRFARTTQHMQHCCSNVQRHLAACAVVETVCRHQ